MILDMSMIVMMMIILNPYVHDVDDEDEDDSKYDFLNLRERVEMARKCLEKEEEVNQ